MFGRLGGVLSRFLVVLEGPRGVLRGLLGVLAGLGPLLGDLGSLMGRSWPVLGGSWVILGRYWLVLGCCCLLLVESCVDVGSFRGCLCSILGRFLSHIFIAYFCCRSILHISVAVLLSFVA